MCSRVVWHADSAIAISMQVKLIGELVAINRDGAIARLKEHEAELRRFGVEHFYLFGSTARGYACADVDLFFDYPRGELGLFRLMDVKDPAARILSRQADIMTRASRHPVLRPPPGSRREAV
jgi:predicted nucleotidyltransferase